MRRLVFQLGLLSLIIALLMSACTGEEPQSEDENSNGSNESTEVAEPQDPPEPGEAIDGATPEDQSAIQTPLAPPSGELPQWTILLYLDADDDVLEEDIFIDLNEVELAGSTEQVQILAQLDRFKGAFDGDGDWTSTKRFFVTQDNDLEALGSEEIEDLGEADMGDPQTLVDFAAWGISNYPAEKYALILSDHGSGWPGGWSDPDPVEGSELYLIEIVQALDAIQQVSGQKLELFGMDACLMSQIEVYTAVQPYAHFAVASEETEPALGWAYASWISKLEDDPTMDGGEVARNIVDSYIVEDTRVLDDAARLKAFGASTAEEVVKQFGGEITLSAVDLEKLPEMLAALNNLTNAMSELDQATVAEARTYSQAYTNIFSQNQPSPYIDLGHFGNLLAQISESPEVASASEALNAAIQQTLLAEKHGGKRPGSTGFSIFFPVSSLYQAENYGAQDYVLLVERFAQATSWDEFLGFHYTGTPFNPVEGQASQAPDPAKVVAPGAEPIKLLPIEISTDAISQDGSVLLTSQVEGKNIAYVYTFAGYVDEVTGAVLVTDMDFVFTDNTKEVGGVFYPDFRNPQPFLLEWEWTPTLYTLNDGSLSSFALFEPEDYGAPDEAAIYSVYGIYTSSDGSEPNYAVATFAEGTLLQVFAFSGADGSGAPWEILPRVGDQFMVLYTILTEDENGVLMTSYEDGDVFTFGEQSFTVEAIPAPDGVYVVGFIAVDFDGNEYSQFAPVTVTP